MNDLADITPSRLKFARKRRGITIKKLSEMIGVTTKTLSSYENGKSSPASQTVALLSHVLNFPEKFFFMEEIKPIKQESVSFRSLARMSATVRDASLHASHIATEFTSLINKKFETPKVMLPKLTGYSPEAAADVVRNEWTLGELPINSMIHLLESKGVMVFSLAEDTFDMDAYSFWMNDIPFIFLNNKKTVERSRFDAAHELGHLILHHHAMPEHDASRGKEAESEAHKFASAFLMPQKSVVSYSVRYPSLSAIISLKSIWRVSAAALVRRWRDLELLTEWQYRRLSIELSRHDYLKKEPKPILKPETSKLLPMLFQALAEDGISKNDIAQELGCFASELDALMFNTSSRFTLIEGGAKQNNSIHYNENGKNHLRFIK